MDMSERLGAIIVAAGSGTRMGGVDKLFTEVAGRPLLAHSLAAFGRHGVNKIVVVLAGMNIKKQRHIVQRLWNDRYAIHYAAGGRRRQDSVRNGLEALGVCDFVFVHDGARPLVTPELIERGLEAARETGAAVPGVRIADTVKEAGEDRLVVRTVDRSRLWAVQTPQVFRRDLLERAHREVTADATDDAAMVEELGVPVRVFEGDRWNTKVTVAADLEVVWGMLERMNLSADMKAD